MNDIVSTNPKIIIPMAAASSTILEEEEAN